MGLGEHFSSGAVVQNRQNIYDLYLLIFGETMKLIISLLECLPGATTLRKFPRSNMF